MIVDNRGIVNSKKKKHCNLRSRNYDDGESAKDVVCKKVVSQGVEGQSIKYAPSRRHRSFWRNAA